MKNALLILPMLAGISAAATTDVFDFGRADSTTGGAINISKELYEKNVDGTFVTDGQGNKVVNTSDPVVSTNKLLSMAGSFTISYVKDGYPVGAGGISPTVTSTEEANWKNNFTGTRPFGLADTFADGLLAQTTTHTAAITLTFSGLQAGTYTLSAFGGFFGKDVMNNVTAELSTTADWTTQQTSTDDGTWKTEVTSTGVSSYEFTNSSNKQINHGYALTAKNITVGEDGSLIFTIAGTSTALKTDSLTEYLDYGRTPLNYVALTQVATVPEPATATLSLLALAGLAMRRRRK